MDYHPTVEHYMASKMRLFGALLPKGSSAVIFADDQWSAEAIAAARKAGHDVRTVGRNGDFIALKRVEHFRPQAVAEVHVGDDIYEIHVPLAGDFQIANALVAAGLAMSTGITAKAHSRRWRGCRALRGGWSSSDRQGTAHSPMWTTPTSRTHSATCWSRASLYHRRVVVVFGCGGDRDKGKRPIMGEIASRLADVVIVTDDNPRSEVPEVIVPRSWLRPRGLRNRRSRRGDPCAVGMLKTGDTLIVAGKGHEEGQTVGSVTLPFSDHAEVRKALGGL